MRSITFSIIALLFLLSSCQPEEDLITEYSTAESVNLFAKGNLLMQDSITPFHINIGLSEESIELYDEYITCQSDFSAGELGPVLIAGFYSSGTYNLTRPLFGVKFWNEQISPASRDWTSEELDNFFTPGRTFEFGEGYDKAEVLLTLPVHSFPLDYELKASRPSYLDAPTGSLTITSIENYSYPVRGRISDRRYGKIIHCTFSGQLGVYDSYADGMDGYPGFSTTEVAEIIDGEAAFYINYDEY